MFFEGLLGSMIQKLKPKLYNDKNNYHWYRSELRRGLNSLFQLRSYSQTQNGSAARPTSLWYKNKTSGACVLRGWGRWSGGWSVGLVHGHCDRITSDALHGTWVLWGCVFQGRRVSWLGSRTPPPSASQPRQRTWWRAVSAGPSGTRTRARQGERKLAPFQITYFLCKFTNRPRVDLKLQHIAKTLLRWTE